MISLIVAVAVAGVIVWLFNYLIPMDPKFRTVLNVLVGLFLFLFILDAFGLWKMPGNLR